MYSARHAYRPHGGPVRATGDRLQWLEWFLLALGCALVARLFFLQMWSGSSYRLLASSQHELQERLIPQRGRILVRDRTDGTLHPLATNRDAWTLYAVPREMTDPSLVARELALLIPPDADLIGAVSTTEAALAMHWASRANDPYEPIAKHLTTEQADAIKAKRLPGIGFAKEWARFYPEKNIGGHVVGFVRTEEGMGKGVYGIEGALDAELAGRAGFVNAQKDAGGRRLALGTRVIQDATDGSDVVLTLDRTIQHEACRRLSDAVKRHGADGGSVVILDPDTGAVLAMCSVPDFDSAAYGTVNDVRVFNNPVTFDQYEPGSVFKAFTMALGLEHQKISPKTTYTDTGSIELDDFTIKNADGKAHGVQTMTQALDESLNTGTIFVQQLLGKQTFREGVAQFGFGKSTGIELTPEAVGDISSLEKKGSVFAATASFGQGISMTPMQLATAYVALANGGTLLRPYIVDEVQHPDGTKEKTKPQTVGRALSTRASKLITGMLVSAVERGHGKRAGVPGYYVAGKTGTAQVPDPKGPGYLKDVNIGSFAGYAPAENPQFVMLVKIDHPRDVQWAESSAAPLWGEIAAFLMTYLEVPMERDPAALPEIQEVPVQVSVTTTGTP
jgi:cell division protein FtsI/penicillin-binding protein 2